MADEHSRRDFRGGRYLALLIVGVFLGTLLLTPVGAHVSGWAHNWNKHIRPRADNRYFNKTQANNRFRSVWALVEGDASITDQSGGITVTKGAGDGRYYVHLGRNLSGQPLLVTPKYEGANDNQIRAAKAVPCGGSGAVPGGVTCAVAGTDNPSTAYVEIHDETNTSVDTPFYIVLAPAR